MDIQNLGNVGDYTLVRVNLNPSEASADLAQIYLSMDIPVGSDEQKTQEALNELINAVGEDAFREKVNNEIMRRFAPRVFDQAEVDFIGEPLFACSQDFINGQEFSFDIQGVPLPEVNLSSYDPVSVRVRREIVTDDMVEYQIQDFLNNSQDMCADTSKTTVESDSMIRMSITTSRYGKPMSSLTFDEVDYQMGCGALPDGFDANVAGMQVGQTSTFQYGALDEQDTNSFESTVTVVAILSDTESELTDEWVCAHFDGFTTVEELRVGLRAEMEKESEENYAQQKNYLVSQELAKRVTGGISQLVLQACGRQGEAGFEQNLAQRGMTREQYLRQTGMTADQLQQQFIERARASVQQDLALDAVARQAALELTDEDFEQYVATVAPRDGERFKYSLKANGGMRQAQREALRLKATKYAADQAIEL